MTKSIATRESILADFDTLRDNDDPDEMIADFDNADMLPELLNYLIDDPHADPESYMPSSPTFCAINHFDPKSPLLRYYDRDDFKLSYRMIAEMIASECDDAIAQLTADKSNLAAILAIAPIK